MTKHRTVLVAVAAMSIVILLAVTACASSQTTQPTQPKGGDLTGVTWQLNKLNGSQAPAGPKPVTATFSNGTVSGFSGVNTYSGPYTAGQDGAFKAGPLASTLMAGAPEAMQLEKGYQEALGNATSYYAANGTLTLYDTGGVPIVGYLTAK